MNQTILLQPGEKNENRPFDNMVRKKHKRTVINYKRPCDFEGQDHQCLWQTWHSKKKIRSEYAVNLNSLHTTSNHPLFGYDFGCHLISDPNGYWELDLSLWLETWHIILLWHTQDINYTWAETKCDTVITYALSAH